MLSLAHYICIFFTLWTLSLLTENACAAEARTPSPGAHTCSLWEGSLTPEQHAKAESILAEAKPRLDSLRREMRAKRKALESLNYNNETDPEALSSLGLQLQKQRNALMQELRKLNARLQNEVGPEVRMHGSRGRGCAALEHAPPCPLPQNLVHTTP